MKKIIFVRHGESTENVAAQKGIEYNKNNIVLTDKGKKQAEITGQYLYEVFGKFDKVYASPATRCVQTANIIIDQINYKKKLKIDNLLVEIGYYSNDLDGISKDSKEKILNNLDITLPKDKLFKGIKKFGQLEIKLKEIKDPFDKLKIWNFSYELEPLLNMKPTTIQVANNYKHFLKNIKESNDKTILVISHGGCIGTLQKFICNIDINNFDAFNGDTKNCCICCISLEKNKYSVVSFANTKHLEKLNNSL